MSTNTATEPASSSTKKAKKMKTEKVTVTRVEAPTLGASPGTSPQPPLPRPTWTEESTQRLASLKHSLAWEAFNLSQENLKYFQDLEAKGELSPLEINQTSHLQTMTKKEWLALRERIILILNDISGLIFDWADAPNNEDDAPDPIDFAEAASKSAIALALLLRLADDVASGQVTFWKETPKKTEPSNV